MGIRTRKTTTIPKKKKKIFIQYLYRDFEIRKMKISFFFCWRFVSLNLDFLQTTGETEIEREAREGFNVPLGFDQMRKRQSSGRELTTRSERQQNKK